MSDFIWETFDSLFKTVHRQGRQVEALEARIAELERRLDRTVLLQQTQSNQQLTILSEMTAERAA